MPQSNEDPNAGMHVHCPNCGEWYIRVPFQEWYPYCSLCAIELGIPGAPERAEPVVVFVSE